MLKYMPGNRLPYNVVQAQSLCQHHVYDYLITLCRPSLLPEVVLVPLLDHGYHHDEEHGHEPGLGRDGGVYQPGKDKGYLKI